MEMIIKTIIITIFVGTCCYYISQGINQKLQNELVKQKELAA